MFSVVIPVFNNRKTLARAVRSVLSQQGPGLELIVVDDGSSDGSLDALAAISDPRLRTLRQDNGGAGAARNAGIAAAVHEWVALLDADDLWLPGHLEELDAVRRAVPEAGLIGTACATAPPGAAEALVPRREGRIGPIRYFAAVGRGERPFGASSAAVRKEAWQAVGGFSTSRDGPDSEFWVRLAFAWPVATSTRVTAIYAMAVQSDSDRARRRRFGNPPASLAGLTPGVARALEHYPQADAALRRDIDLYVLRYLDFRLRQSIALGDLVTLRALRRLYPAPPPLEHRLLLALAALPDRLALAAYRAALAAKAAARRLSVRRSRTVFDRIPLH